MILIYSDTMACYQYFTNLNISFSYTRDYEYFKNATGVFKVAITNRRFGYSGYYNLEPYLQKISQIGDLVFLLECEFHEDNIEVILRNAPKIYYFMPGYATDICGDVKSLIFTPSWPTEVADLYHNFPDITNSFATTEVKPKMFDALLGRAKEHRTFIYNSLVKNNLINAGIVSYSKDYLFDSEESFKQYNFVMEPGVELVDHPTTASTARARYRGILTTLSQIIPLDIYNKTAYSIVAETDFDNRYSFFTEKIAKPIIARRLFIVFSGYQYLHNLRRAGFRTFDGIIDESYDSIVDDRARLNAAFDQVRQLCLRPQEEVINLIQPIVDHNYNMLMSPDWQKNAWQQKIAKQLVSITEHEYHKIN